MGSNLQILILHPGPQKSQGLKKVCMGVKKLQETNLEGQRDPGKKQENTICVYGGEEESRKQGMKSYMKNRA